MPWAFNDNMPIYLQIMEHIKMRIAVGEYSLGDKILPVRELAAEAEVNPNTMQKALAELEREGLLYSQRTSGRFITSDKKLIEDLKKSLANEYISWYLEKMSQLGFSNTEALEQLKININKKN